MEPTRLAIEFYLQTDPRSANWWWNELRVPARIADAGLLFLPWLASAPHTLAIMLEFSERAIWGDRTGDNLIDEVATVIKRAAIQGNATLMGVGFARLWHEIRVVQPSGCLVEPPGTTGCATDGAATLDIGVDHFSRSQRS